ncbi:hypothetical protein [Serratia marcescens]|uniref:hypothetical protein n=1 Tax=Serratia marcescens TaxID=615 RepID=UPI000CDB2D1F|nr:hypothetical protein [Serratia marcescens]POP21836.1 hypothetical protein C3R39_10720 [Serratia marcescens]POP25510.1 hypothetical protein C3R43_15950 [Serratia marcescens]WLS86884.1 hypothetical protein RAM09_18785 [Serratia marcescens]
MLTIEQLRARAKFWREKAVEAKWESVRIAQDMLQNADAFDELAANREARPVALVDRRPAARGSICWQNGGKDLPHGTELFTATPAPANVRAVAWEMRHWNSGHNMWHDWERITAEQHAEMSAEHATSNDYKFRVLYDAPPAPAVPGIDELRLTFERAERESDDGFNLHKYGIGYADDDTQARWESWMACRAAMLAAAPEGGNDHDTRR